MDCIDTIHVIDTKLVEQTELLLDLITSLKASLDGSSQSKSSRIVSSTRACLDHSEQVRMQYDELFKMMEHKHITVDKNALPILKPLKQVHLS